MDVGLPRTNRALYQILISYYCYDMFMILSSNMSAFEFWANCLWYLELHVSCWILFLDKMIPFSWIWYELESNWIFICWFYESNLGLQVVAFGCKYFTCCEFRVVEDVHCKKPRKQVRIIMFIDQLLIWKSIFVCIFDINIYMCKMIFI